jgi:hypothetical protein
MVVCVKPSASLIEEELKAQIAAFGGPWPGLVKARARPFVSLDGLIEGPDLDDLPEGTMTIMELYRCFLVTFIRAHSLDTLFADRLQYVLISSVCLCVCVCVSVCRDERTGNCQRRYQL